MEGPPRETVELFSDDLDTRPLHPTAPSTRSSGPSLSTPPLEIPTLTTHSSNDNSTFTRDPPTRDQVTHWTPLSRWGWSEVTPAGRPWRPWAARSVRTPDAGGDRRRRIPVAPDRHAHGQRQLLTPHTSLLREFDLFGNRTEDGGTESTRTVLVPCHCPVPAHQPRSRCPIKSCRTVPL